MLPHRGAISTLVAVVVVALASAQAALLQPDDVALGIVGNNSTLVGIHMHAIPPSATPLTVTRRVSSAAASTLHVGGSSGSLHVHAALTAADVSTAAGSALSPAHAALKRSLDTLAAARARLAELEALDFGTFLGVSCWGGRSVGSFTTVKATGTFRRVELRYHSGSGVSCSTSGPNTESRPWDACSGGFGAEVLLRAPGQSGYSLLVAQNGLGHVPGGCFPPRRGFDHLVCNRDFTVEEGAAVAGTYWEGRVQHTTSDNQGSVCGEMWAYATPFVPGESPRLVQA